MKTKQETAKGKIYPAKEIPLEDRPTKKYDEVCTKIKKLLAATAQTFIPELCQALKDDWIPTMSEKDLQSDKNKGVRDQIRDKILRDWGYSVYRTEGAIWKESTIKGCLPRWLRNPSDKLLVTAANARNSKTKEFSLVSEHEKKKIEQIVEELPDEIIEPEEEEKPNFLTDEEMHELGVAPYGETGKSTMTLTGEISLHAYKLFAALTNNTSPPNSSDDIIVDYIKPSRDFFKGLMLENTERKRTEFYNLMHYLTILIEDRMKIIDDIDRK